MSTDETRFYAHSAPEGGESEPLREHLELVAERTEAYAAPFGAGLEGRMAGLLHDAGKATESFSLRLQGKASGLDHWTPGATLALRRYQQHGIAAALAIQGHHLGLSRASVKAIERLFGGAGSPDRTLTTNRFAELLQRLAQDGIDLPELSGSLYDQQSLHAAGQLDVRMLFSALVDADFLETEAHFDRDAQGRRQYRPAPPKLEPAQALAVLEETVAKLAEKNRSRSSAAVHRLRSDLFRACFEEAEQPRGLFTLSAPTGSGKTLSMLAFALRHAQLHGLRRVVMAIPYLSILEQTAKVYRELLEPVFGPGYVLEHHSLAGIRSGESKDDEQGPSPAEVLRRRQAENWDAPLVVTTSVQLLESLFANRPKACRKLHRLAGSVLLFDEVQTLPRGLAVATLSTLSRLAERYESSVVFSTATQPSFSTLDGHVRQWCSAGWRPREIVAADLDLFRRVRRVEVDWRLGSWAREDQVSWTALADELGDLEQVLCIVNLKRHALALAQELRSRGVEGVFHLSTSMCPAHRSARLAEVEGRLARGEPCRLISTQCVEAGVDVDFPVVYRAFAPLDALAQAAGRCNRNGKLAEAGRLVVFLPEEPAKTAYPGGDYRQAAGVTREVLQSLPREQWELESPDLHDRWYRTLYDLSRLGSGERKEERELQQAMTDRDFEAIARRYRLIPDESVQVVVPWDGEAFERLRRASTKTPWVTGDWMREAQIHSVNLYRRQIRDYIGVLLAAPLGAQRPEQRSEDWFFLQDGEVYDEDFGLGDPPVALIQ
ncbi:MAG: CRISPR-associated helicase Cas3' [Gemmatimonadota bacterium]|jgi:CRISPR-associated helicase Cas3/CRISPR-associated endonuclease Cas3-HD